MEHYHQFIPLSQELQLRLKLTTLQALAIELIYSGFNQDYIELLCGLSDFQYQELKAIYDSL